MSPSLLDIFRADARKYVERLRAGMDVDGGPDVNAMRRAARRLHHSAVLANHDPVIRATEALQKIAVQVIAGKRRWSEELASAFEATLAALETAVATLPDGDVEAESRLRSAAAAMLERFGERRQGAVAVPDEAAAPPAGGSDEADSLLEEVVSDLDAAVERLENDPRDREPLKMMLRKIRRLRELGRIEVLSPPDKALTAVEELILQIADLNATVGPGYLTVFSHAREVLEEMRAGGESAPSVTRVGGRAVEVDRLKDQVMEKVRRARQVVWVSDLFYPEGPHIVSCPAAEEQGGPEQYFLNEATQRLERSENLRRTMLQSNTEQMRLAGESLSHTLRHLRERAAAFNHGEFGRVTRRVAAALRVQLVRPPRRLKEMAEGLGGVFAALQEYLHTDDPEERARAVGDADVALHRAILGGELERPAETAEFDPDSALQQAMALRTRVDERLRELSGPEVAALREDLDELFDLISRYVSHLAEHT
jgi:hypothetical protein